MDRLLSKRGIFPESAASECHGKELQHAGGFASSEPSCIRFGALYLGFVTRNDTMEAAGPPSHMVQEFEARPESADLQRPGSVMPKAVRKRVPLHSINWMGY